MRIPRPVPRRLRQDLCAITGDGVAFSVMVGAGETYIPAFVLAVGLSELAAGWIGALPLVAGAVIQLVSPTMIRRVGSLRRWVVLNAVIQASSLLAFAAAAVAGQAPSGLLFLAATIYWAAGLATGPAWNTWVGTIVPPRRRARFFARRSRLSQAALLAALVGGGLALQAGRHHAVLLPVFAALYACAALARLVSAAFLVRQSEGRSAVHQHRVVPVREWIARARHGPDGRLLLYLLAVQVAVQLCGPFFTPYMLGELSFSYLEYLLLIGTSFGAKMLALPVIGALIHRVGAGPVLHAAGVGIIPMSALWLVSDSLSWLFFVQCLGGCIWAAWELTTFLLLFDRIDQSDRTSMLTTFNFANAVALVTGALGGGLILEAMDQARAGYLVLFALSGVLRLATLPLLFRIRQVDVHRYRIAVRPLGVRPNGGSLDAPIVTSLDEPGRPGRDRHRERERPV